MITDRDSWFPTGTAAFQIWMCGRCNTELEPENTGLACPYCSSLYTDTGSFLTDAEDPGERSTALRNGRAAATTDS